MVVYLEQESKMGETAQTEGIEREISRCDPRRPDLCPVGHRPEAAGQLSTFSAAIKASCGMSTLPNWRIRFLPSFCFSSSLRLRVMSPP